MPDDARSPWVLFALGSAVFAALTAIFGKLGVKEINSDLATFIRTIVILVVAAIVVSLRSAWEPISRISRYGMAMLFSRASPQACRGCAITGPCNSGTRRKSLRWIS